MSYYYGWKPYVPVARRQRDAERQLKKMQKDGLSVAPIKIEGMKIAKSFWGQAWCTNLESYSDYQNRLPRGRSYVRNGSVLDLQVAKGKITALVAGSDLYEIEISIKPVVPAQWKSICRDCAGSIDSLVGLLQGRLAKGVMDRVCRKDDGLFPAPKEIKLSCSCPDWAGMCKHVAAAMYGVGARLDQKPELLFVLRGVDQTDLLAGAGPEAALHKHGSAEKVLADDDMAALFGLEMADGADTGEADRVRAEASGTKAIETKRGKSDSTKTATGKRTVRKTAAGLASAASRPPVDVEGKTRSAPQVSFVGSPTRKSRTLQSGSAKASAPTHVIPDPGALKKPLASKSKSQKNKSISGKPERVGTAQLTPPTEVATEAKTVAGKSKKPASTPVLPIAKGRGRRSPGISP